MVHAGSGNSGCLRVIFIRVQSDQFLVFAEDHSLFCHYLFICLCVCVCVCVCVISMELGFYQCNAKRRLCQTWSGVEGGGGGTMCGCLDGEEGCR